MTRESAPESRQQWDAVAAGWQRWWDTIENPASEVSRRLLTLADVVPGQRVLDIATGLGEPALTAARHVGAAGRVVATDLSPQMLAVARRRAAASGLANVEFIEADAARLEFPSASFDAVLCRWGITSLPRPFAILSAIRRLLTPNGAFATSVWEAGPTGRPLASLATALAHEMFEEPSVLPRPPAGDASVQQTLARQMRRAGFTDVRTEAMSLTLAWRSTEECIRYLLDVSPDLAALVSARATAEQSAFRRELAARLRPYVTEQGNVRIPNVTICAAGRH